MNRFQKHRTTGFIQTFSYALIALAFAPLYALAQHTMEQHQVEEVFITGEIAKSATETALPTTILSGEDLRQAADASLGKTLQNQLGINSASFGSGVGLPVIRGQSGARVGVIQNGISSMDAASASQDHANSIDPLVAERIEIIRGPATLLYGNGAIGGVVNVIDNRIPETLPEAMTGALELRHNSVSSEDSGAFKLENNAGNIAWHLDGAYRDSGTTRIPGYAINEEALDSEHEHEEHEEHEHEHEEHNSFGRIDNSDSHSRSLAAGGSWIGEGGFAGFSISHLENEYGLPPGSHIHSESHEEEHEGEHEEEHEEGDIRIDLRQTRYEFKGELDTHGLFNRLSARLAYNDYEHTEYALAHDPADVPDHGHTGTHFTNQGFETRLTAHHGRGEDRAAVNPWDGVVGLQFSQNEFAVTGEEGFIPRTDIQSVGIFALESINTGRWIYEVGARLQQVELAPDGNCSREDTSWSASAAAIWQLSETINTSVSLGRAQRSAGVEERYSNLNTASYALATPTDWQVHSPTGLIELGNPDLEEETSNNIEFSLHKHLGNLHGEISVYFNRANDYIYLAETQQHIDERPVAQYQQRDAEFYGYEAEITLPVKLSASRQMELTLFSDAVQAEFTTGEYLPRIPPRRAGFSLKLQETDWSISLRTTRVASGTHLAPEETPTEDYTLLDVNADYHFGWSSNELLIFAQGFNLLDETVRNHVSFTKDIAPEPGRGVKAGVRLIF